VLAQAATAVPEPVSQVVSRMLAKRPAERFPDVVTAMQALHAAVYPPRLSMPERPSAPQASGDDNAQKKWWQVFTGPKR
jgi:hypothetical protein